MPKHTKAGTTNQLTDLLSEFKGLPEDNWDVRHENLEGIGLLPAETRDGAILPIILEMINAGQIAPSSILGRNRARHNCLHGEFLCSGN